MLHKRFTSWSRPILNGILGMTMAFLVLSIPALASHLGGSNIQSMHDATKLEWVCINYISGDNSNFNQTFTRVRGTLYWDTPPTGESNWDSLAYDPWVGQYKVWFVVWSTACGSLSTTDRNNTPIEIMVQENTTADCGGNGLEGDGVNCAWKDGAFVSHSSGGVTHYDYAKGYNMYNDIYIGSSTESLWRHVISHEMAHLLGLPDGDGTCPASVTHSKYYGCSTDYPWPQSGDRNSATNRANGTQ